MMYELMAVKKEDDEFVLQIAHSLTSLLACQATRSVLLDSTQVHSTRHIDLITGSSYAAQVNKRMQQNAQAVHKESWLYWGMSHLCRKMPTMQCLCPLKDFSSCCVPDVWLQLTLQSGLA